MQVNSQIIRQNGWRQGACLLVDASKEIFATTKCMQERLSEGLYVVLSQDCDILNSSLQKEPVIELIRADRIAKCDHEFTSGKNPRQLHVELSGGNYCLELFPYNRFFISRKYLETGRADKVEIAGDSLRAIINWICKRYRRHGFPDAFNKRCKPIMKEIKQILSKEAKNIRGIFIRLATEKELEPNETYKLIIKMLVLKKDYEDEQELSKIEAGFEKMLALFADVRGIEIIVGSKVQSLDEITVHGYQELKEWDFDYISFLNGEADNPTSDIVL